MTATKTRTRIVVLQHPREAQVSLGTLRMLELSLPEAIVRRGVEFTEDPHVQALCREQPRPYVLFPGEQSLDLAELPSGPPITLVVIDGTWSQAKSILRRNPALAALPRVALTPGAPSAYRIRRQPAAHCVSTIEALARALDVLEGPPGHFERVLLRPLHALVESQLRYSREDNKVYRIRRPRPEVQAKPPPSDSAERVRASWEHLVCVQGEAHGWPANHPERREPELVQWRACRLATGETFSATIRPHEPLSPWASRNVELPAEALLAGMGFDTFAERWEAFVLPDDVLAVWGHFHSDLGARQGLTLPRARLDVRVAAARVLRKRSGTVEQCAERLGLCVGSAFESGRCARRMALLEAITHRLRDDQPPWEPAC